MPTNANSDSAGEEQRRWQRYQFTVPVRVTIEQPRHATLVDTRACEMNDGGITICAKAELSIGAQLEIRFMPPSFDFPLTLRGVVRDAAKDRYGVEFLVTSAAEKEHLMIFGEILRG
jgi:hypothetical protein